MDMYKEHFLMKENDVLDYTRKVLKYFNNDEHIIAKEIGDGNINYVFKVENPETGKSIIIKQADTVLRSSGRKLDMHRNKIEATILGIEGELAPKFVPKLYNYDEYMYALAMEDISEFKNLRSELAKGKTFNHLAEDISEFLAKTLLPTTDLILDSKIKKERIKEFINPDLCEISEDLVFTEPYFDYKNRNIILEENLSFVEDYLYNDESLKNEVIELKNNFKNNTQSLIHGDLHSGSIFINENGLKVIDPEFAFYGPAGYDIGNIIGNLYFAWANKVYTDSDNIEFLTWIESTIVNIYDMVKVKLNDIYDEKVTFEFYKNESFKNNYIDKILSDAVGYAGTEIIRRVVGDTKVKEINSIDQLEKRLPMERLLINTGIDLIKNRSNIANGQQMINKFKGMI